MTAPLLGTVDPTDVVALQTAVNESDPDGLLAPIGLSQIEIGRHALDVLPEAVSRLAGGDGRPIAMLVDRTPMYRSGQDLKPLVHAILEDRFRTSLCTLGEAEAELHTDEDAINDAVAALSDASCVVAVGSGTVTDIAKEASARVGNLPLVVVQTAASVNAFSDNMAVVLQSGVKRTVSSRWPDVLLVDLHILASAPRNMNLAGFGDLLSLWTAPADWRLASLLGMDPSYHPSPVRLLSGHGEELLRSASLLSAGDLAGLDCLANTLTLSGIAMGISGSTAPLSGTEHLISHLLDMKLAHDQEPLRLHGAQVGLAAVLASELWRQFLSGFDAGSIDLDGFFPAERFVHETVLEAFSDLDPTGRIGGECWNDCRKKLEKWNQCRSQLVDAIGDWEACRAELAASVRPPSQLADALRSAGAVAAFAQLDPPLPLETVRWAIRRLPFMRKRFTLADLFFYSGHWNDQVVERVIDNCRGLGIFA